jgi:hypothetical protein
MAISYFGSPLSDNIIKREDGSLVCLDCVLGRTGFQEYRVADLPQQRAQDLGIDTRDQEAKVKLYRSPDEVFHPDYIQSVEASAVTDNHPPGNDFVTPENFTDYARGHVQNVRKGKEPLESGEWPLIGDIVIAAEPLLSDVLNKRKREISLGYDYNIDRDGDVIEQVGMINNHVAIVPKGRAGSEARINDAAPVEILGPVASTVVPEVKVEPEPVAKTSTVPATHQAPKENKPMSWTLKSLFGMGLKAAAKEDNADPEALADAAQQFSRMTRGSARANDSESDLEFQDEPDGKSAEDKCMDRKVKDRKVRDRHADDRRTDDRHADDRHADDRHADDERGRMHKMLDRMLDARAARSDDRHSDDADMNQLREILDDYLQEEQHEPEHMEADDVDPDEIPVPEEKLEADDEAGEEPFEEEEPIEAQDEFGEVTGEAEVAEDRHADDVEGFSDPRRKRARDASRQRAADAAFGALEALRAMKPVVARCKDSAVVKAYNAQLRRLKGSSFPGGGGYGDFAGSARDHSRAKDSVAAPDKTLAELTNFYRAAHGKKNSPVEVK